MKTMQELIPKFFKASNAIAHIMFNVRLLVNSDTASPYITEEVLKLPYVSIKQLPVHINEQGIFKFEPCNLTYTIVQEILQKSDKLASAGDLLGREEYLLYCVYLAYFGISSEFDSFQYSKAEVCLHGKYDKFFVMTKNRNFVFD